MVDIIVDDEQARAIIAASGAVRVRDSAGRILCAIAPRPLDAPGNVAAAYGLLRGALRGASCGLHSHIGSQFVGFARRKMRRNVYATHTWNRRVLRAPNRFATDEFCEMRVRVSIGHKNPINQRLECVPFNGPTSHTRYKRHDLEMLVLNRQIALLT